MDSSDVILEELPIEYDFYEIVEGVPADYTLSTSDCAIIYDECNYKGKSIEICDSTPNLEYDNFVPKSIYVPKGKKLFLYNLTDFEGKKKGLIESIECIEDFKFDFLSLKLNMHK